MRRANAGIARILEAIVAATIIFIAFTAASFFVSDSKTAVAQDRTDLDRIGYNTLSKLTESGTIEATIEKTPAATDELRSFIRNSLPQTMIFNLTVTRNSPTEKTWTVSNLMDTDESLSKSMAVSSTPMMYTSKGSSIYYLVLVLANPGQGA